MAGAKSFTFDDQGSFDENLKAFASQATVLDATLAPILVSALAKFSTASPDERSGLLDTLLAAVKAPVSPNPQPSATSSSAQSAPVVQTVKPTRWFLEQIEIEGFRGINNEGSPLVLKFKADAINSVTAPNGVGKSSIYDGLLTY